MKRKFFLNVSIVIVCLSVLCGCYNTKENDISVLETESRRPEKLVVCMSAVSHTIANEDGEETLYPSKYAVGTILAGGETNAPNGNIFEMALQEYEEMTGIEIEVHYLEEYLNEITDPDPLQDQYESSELPDVLIFSKHPWYDYFRLAQQELLLDFTPYVIEDETLINDEEYYQQVLDGGIIQEKQYALPILFNLNAMITTESYLDSIGAPVGKENLSFEEILNILNASCIAQADSKTVSAIWEGSGFMPQGMYIPSILTGAAYSSYFDEKMQSVVLEKEVIADIFEVIKNFIWQDLTNAPNRENNTYEEYLENRNYSKSVLTLFSQSVEQIGITLVGGRSGGGCFYNSLLTDAAFFQSAYEKRGETMVLKGIPTYNDPNYYSANASLVAYGMASTEYPKAVYDLVRYLMDYGFPPAYGFSVNKELTQKQLELMTATSYTVSPESVWTGVEFGIDIEELEQSLMYTEPLDEETVEVIRNMLDHIAGAGLPCAVLERNPYYSMVRMIGSNQMTPDEVGDWVVKTMEEYLTMQDTLKPFYDEAYNASVILEGVN